MKKYFVVVSLVLALCGAAWAEDAIVLRYSHPNAPTSIAGMQADFLAKKVKEYTKGAVTIEVYPSSKLGTLQEQATLVSSGAIALHHNTAAGIGSLYEDFAVLDTPYLYKDVDSLMKVTNPNSSVMTKLNDGLLKKSGVRVLYTFYFGARDLTADRPIYKPTDLKGLKIRSIPFPIYSVAVEGMGATPMPIDWSQTITALQTKVVNGQENPVNTILSSKLYESQGYLMLTHHILGAEVVVVNNSVWNKLSKENQAAISKAAAETSAYATKLTEDGEASDTKALKDKGMKVIGAAEGLDLAAFKKSVNALVSERFGAKWADYYKLIADIQK